MEMAGSGVVSPETADAIQIDVTLIEWVIVPHQLWVKTGKTYLPVENIGLEAPHEPAMNKSYFAP